MLGKALERLASGKRLIPAGDDAAGLGIATGLETQLERINQGILNINQRRDSSPLPRVPFYADDINSG